MLVEDDNNLREIYEARLLAEGYEIVSARDGEEALALAVKERPDLIIADIMMPKISGFDMLDILRTTPETKETKVIMMTALSQAEDRDRADKLGADRYLVKSQVTLEDVAKVARDVLEGTNAHKAPAGDSAEAGPSGPSGGASTTPVQDDDDDAQAADDTKATPQAPSLDKIKAVSTTEEQAAVTSKIEDFVSQLPTPGNRVVQPINDISKKPDLDKLLAEEELKEAANNAAAPNQSDKPAA